MDTLGTVWTPQDHRKRDISESLSLVTKEFCKIPESFRRTSAWGERSTRRFGSCTATPTERPGSNTGEGTGGRVLALRAMEAPSSSSGSTSVPERTLASRLP